MNRATLIGLALIWAGFAHAQTASDSQPVQKTNIPQVNCPLAPCTIPYGETGPASASVAVANTTHNAGTSIGGLIQITVNSPQAIFTGLGYKSENASVAAVMIRAWNKAPAGCASGVCACTAGQTCCNDGTAFVSNNADDLSRVVGFPTASITPAAPAQTTGDSATYGDQTIQTWSFRNQDSPQVAKIYLCVIAAANDTLDPGHNIDLILAGPQP